MKTLVAIRNLILIALVLIPVSLFNGVIMVSIAGGAMFPSIYRISYPVFEKNGDKVIYESRNFSYKPGQQGTINEHHLVKPNGERRDIGLRVLVVSGIIFSFMLWLVSLIATAIAAIINKIPLVPEERSENIISTAFVISLYVNIGIMLLVMAIGFLYGLVWMGQALINAW